MDTNQIKEAIEDAIYQLESLKRVLDLPEKGYTRNGYERVIRTLKEALKEEEEIA